jgi:hypothetical protein
MAARVFLASKVGAGSTIVKPYQRPQMIPPRLPVTWQNSGQIKCLAAYNMGTEI